MSSKSTCKSKTEQMVCLLISIALVIVTPLTAFADPEPERISDEYRQDEPGQTLVLVPERPEDVMPEASEDSQEISQPQTQGSQAAPGEGAADQEANMSTTPLPEQEAADTQSVADLSSAHEQLDGLSGQLEKLASLKQGWSDLYSRYASDRDELKRLQDEHAVVTAKIKKHEEDANRAQAVIDAANEELALVEGEGFAAFALRLVQSAEIESNVYLLHELVADRANVVTSANSARSGLERMQADISEKMQDRGKRRLESRSKLNMASCEMEAACSRARKSMQDALGLLSGHGENPQLQEDVARIQGEAQAAAGSIAEFEAILARYYDELDAISGINGAISFGEGADFAMNEYVFVEKWGKAIDTYLDEYAKEAGDIPLRSYGKQMATAAYRHRIDPRLCAAVSVVESSGGKFCIKPHNAWGWGAADSNPYEGAASWDSFDEAIEQWHKNMASSKTGLATARTVSTLAIVYCSNPAWGADVADIMGKISAAAL